MHSANITHCSTQIIQLPSETIVTVIQVNSLQRVRVAGR